MTPHPERLEGHKIGLALGSGSARGWSHIGVIRELKDLGIEPDIVCGSSIGALVGAAYCSGHLDSLEEWLRSLTRLDVARNIDLGLLAGGGAIKGKKLFDFFRRRLGDVNIEDLPKPFAAVATNLATGREVWLQQGSLFDAARASISVPGLFTPVKRQGEWLVDGGLVNPVPVSICQVLGADIVIAVNLNGELIRRTTKHTPHKIEKEEQAEETESLDTLTARITHRKNVFLSHLFETTDDTPGIIDVLSATLNIMQDRITRSRMASEYPNFMITPRLAHIGLMDYHRASECIEEGRASVRRMRPAFQGILLEE